MCCVPSIHWAPDNGLQHPFYASTGRLLCISGVPAWVLESMGTPEKLSYAWAHMSVWIAASDGTFIKLLVDFLLIPLVFVQVWHSCNCSLSLSHILRLFDMIISLVTLSFACARCLCHSSSALPLFSPCSVSVSQILATKWDSWETFLICSASYSSFFEWR